MPNIGKILRAIGQGAAIASQFTPAGAAVTKGLDIGGRVLNRSNQSVDPPDSIHELAVQTVLDNLPTIFHTASERADGETLAHYLSTVTAEIELWLTAEAARYATPSK